MWASSKKFENNPLGPQSGPGLHHWVDSREGDELDGRHVEVLLHKHHLGLVTISFVLHHLIKVQLNLAFSPMRLTVSSPVPISFGWACKLLLWCGSISFKLESHHKKTSSSSRLFWRKWYRTLASGFHVLYGISGSSSSGTQSLLPCLPMPEWLFMSK